MLFNPFDPSFHTHRYDAYARMRDEAPVLPFPLGDNQGWVVTRYADVARVIKNPNARVRGHWQDDAPRHFRNGAAATLWRNQVVLSDPPDHTRLRKLAMPAFKAKLIHDLEHKVRASVQDRLRELGERSEIDFVADFAAFVPAKTILHILDISENDWEPLLSRVPDFLNIFSPLPLDDETAERTNAACAFYIDYFGALIDERSKSPKDDIVGNLIMAHDAGDRLNRDELIAMLQTFLNAGFETTMSALGTGMYGVLSQSAFRDAIAADPRDRVPAAFEEMLRWEAPVHFVNRFLDEPTTLSDVTVPADQPVLLCLASANRDPRQFDAPDELKLDRGDSEHLTFGGGRHFCIGAQLAKMEARVALKELFSMYPDISLVSSVRPERHTHLLFPAIKSLPVALGALRDEVKR